MKTTRIIALTLMAAACSVALAYAAHKPAKPVVQPAPAAEAPVDPAYMWDLGDLYASPEAWTAERDRVKAVIDGLGQYKGTLGKSAKDMLAALNAFSDVQRATTRMSAYAGLKADEDVRIAGNQERNQLAASLSTAFNEKTAWVTPEILAIGADKVMAFEKAEPDLARRFGFQLDNI